MTMPGGIVCYIARAGSGSMIRSVRLLAAGLDRSWTAPEVSSVSSVDAEGPSPALGVTRAAAEFIESTLSSVGMRRLAAICLDADGAVCAWLSAPSPEPGIVRATIEQSALEADASGAGVGAARLLSMSTAAPGTGSLSDVSVQALATLEPEPGEAAPEPAARASGARSLVARFRKPVAPAGVAAPGKSRFAVLAVPDAPVRVLIDELDARGVEVQAVLSLWHALGAGLAGPGDAAAAVLIVEPEGRLVWSWSKDDGLLAGGTMRLSTFSPGATDRLPATAPAIEGSEAQAPAHARVGVEFSPADAGRLAMDWLAWSAQLGTCPRRVVCVVPPSLGTPEGDGPQVLPRLLARVWPGATIDAAVNPDPVGLALSRVAGLGPTPRAADASDAPAQQRPREALVDLSARPGRADRALHRWIAGTLAALAFVVGAVGWQVYRSVDAVKQRTAEVIAERNKVLDELRVLVRDDNLPRMVPAAQEERIAGARKQAQDVLKILRPPRPVLDETARLLEALDGVEGVKLTELEVNNVLARATILLPTPRPDAPAPEQDKARNAGPTIIERLSASPGVLGWKGEAPAFSPEGQRRYLLSALWPERIEPVRRTPRPAAPAPPAPAAEAQPAPASEPGPDTPAAPPADPANPEPPTTQSSRR